MISAVILTKNNQSQITNCLKSLSWCDEIVIIDDQSTDETVGIVQKHGAIVFVHDLANDFSQQRNLGLEKAKGEWVLFVDADEIVSEQLQKEILSVINNSEAVSGYYIQRIDIMWKKPLKFGEVRNASFLRLAKKNAGQWRGKVHETWHISGSTAVLKNLLVHYPHQTIKEFLSEINFYSTIRAEELYQQKVKANMFSIIAFPKAKFFVNYVLKSGYKDGIFGLILAFMMSFHSFLVRAKLWQLWQQEKINS